MSDHTRLGTTSGLFISEEPPFGATVLVLRREAGAVEYLVLRRSLVAGDHEDWAWGPPSGARLPGEDVEACARRELEEETGLRLALHGINHSPDWASYWTEAPFDTPVRLSMEHDRYEWVTRDEAVRRCRPAIVAEQFEALADAAAA
jgi:8-oxo-dGTP pyrophosphatase MutT (NUDIX family)